MEYTQWVKHRAGGYKDFSLNPCCNGIYSMSIGVLSGEYRLDVLILVVMEYTQWENHQYNSLDLA